MERRTITTKEQLFKLLSLYDWNNFDPCSLTVELWDDDADFYAPSKEVVKVDGDALEFLLLEEAASDKRVAEALRLCEEKEKDVLEEDVEAPTDCYYDSLHLPCGGVFKGDFGSATKAQVKAANREWRRRKSTGRFSDDGSRWN